jgi:hypothetical protein
MRANSGRVQANIIFKEKTNLPVGVLVLRVVEVGDGEEVLVRAHLRVYVCVECTNRQTYRSRQRVGRQKDRQADRQTHLGFGGVLACPV